MGIKKIVESLTAYLDEGQRKKRMDCDQIVVLLGKLEDKEKKAEEETGQREQPGEAQKAQDGNQDSQCTTQERRGTCQGTDEGKMQVIIGWPAAPRSGDDCIQPHFCHTRGAVVLVCSDVCLERMRFLPDTR